MESLETSRVEEWAESQQGRGTAERIHQRLQLNLQLHLKLNLPGQQRGPGIRTKDQDQGSGTGIRTWDQDLGSGPGIRTWDQNLGSGPGIRVQDRGSGPGPRGPGGSGRHKMAVPPPAGDRFPGDGGNYGRGCWEFTITG
ncbi:hypothetical protein EYF80_051679 [Liparis tanakae]|uniref:Uncharacterized protein n=1 Tax=Liparis tanakae TaxID=230148 RepID=A0A4Z2FBL8_9TELE|nr:hypothetical protein EYF80_051679 [Liparis tanakae]